MSMKSFTIDGHTVEFAYGSSSLDPWSSGYCREIGLSLMCTSDMVPFVRIDGERIIKLRHGNTSLSMKEALGSGVLTSLEEFLEYFSDEFETEFGLFSELKKELDEAKKRSDAFKKLSPEEKRRYLDNIRAERKAAKDGK